MVGQSAFYAVGFIRITVGNRAWPGRPADRSDHLIRVLGRLRLSKRQSATGGPSCGNSRLFAWAILQPESERFMVPKSIPREGATAGCHAVLTRRETVRFSDAWFISEKWLGWQGSNLRMAVPKTAALPLGYTPAGGVRYNASDADVKGGKYENQAGERIVPDGGAERASIRLSCRSRSACAITLRVIP